MCRPSLADSEGLLREVDVVVLDVFGRNFDDNVAAIAKGLPRPAIICSALTPAAEDIARAHGLPFLGKPFDRDELLSLIREAAAPHPR